MINNFRFGLGPFSGSASLAPGPGIVKGPRWPPLAALLKSESPVVLDPCDMTKRSIDAVTL